MRGQLMSRGMDTGSSGSRPIRVFGNPSRESSNLVARRVLRGLGLLPGDVPHVMEGLGAVPSGDRMADTASVLDIVSAGMFSPSRDGLALWLSRTDRMHSAVSDQEWVAGSMDGFMGSVVLAEAPSVGGSRLAWAYVNVPDGFEPRWLVSPPAVLLLGNGGIRTWYREASDLFRDMSSQLGWRPRLCAYS